MVSQGSAASGRIFISYRREETAYPAGWLYDRLANSFGATQIFKDIDSIEPGDDFVERITGAVGSCDVLVALIGPEWLSITDAQGSRRLDDPNDFVRLEIEAALSRDVRVIPILVDGATMPRAQELPPTLAALVRRQALELSPSRFAADLVRLQKVLENTLSGPQHPPVEPSGEPAAPAPRASEVSQPSPSSRLRRLLSSPRGIAVCVMLCVVLLVVGIVVLSGSGTTPSDGGDSPVSEEDSTSPWDPAQVPVLLVALTSRGLPVRAGIGGRPPRS